MKRKQNNLRPTSNRVREAIFDILRGNIEGTRFLDLYAGTGAVGLDALKEGAAEVIFVEESRRQCANISNVINKLHLPGRTEVINKKVLTFIEWAELEGVTIDIIFLDPPYHTEEINYALKAIGRSNILDQNGTVIAEHFSKRALPEKFDRLHKIKDYPYGDSILSFYR